MLQTNHAISERNDIRAPSFLSFLFLKETLESKHHRHVAEIAVRDLGSIESLVAARHLFFEVRVGRRYLIIIVNRRRILIFVDD